MTEAKKRVIEAREGMIDLKLMIEKVLTANIKKLNKKIIRHLLFQL